MLRDVSLIPLSRDHHHALALCLRITRALSANPTEPNFPAQAQQVCIAFEREIGAHFETEEQVLFPALANVPAVSALILELLEEHRALRSLVALLHTSSDRALL